MAKVAKRRGRYVLDFYDHTGTRRREALPEGTKKAQADEELRIRAEQVLRGCYLPESRVPLFSQVAQDWLEYKKPRLRETTWEVYQGHTKHHFSSLNDLKITHTSP